MTDESSKLTGEIIMNEDRTDLELYQAAQYESKAAAARHDVALERSRPFYMLRPVVSLDGNAWCCLFGENIQVGVCGFGDTPHEASLEFDKAWVGKK